MDNWGTNTDFMKLIGIKDCKNCLCKDCINKSKCCYPEKCSGTVQECSKQIKGEIDNENRKD